MVHKKKNRSHKKSFVATSRTVAIKVVQQVRHGNTAVQAALDREFGATHLSGEERPLCTELVYGTLRNFMRLESFLRRFLEDFDGLPVGMQMTLCVALYELFYTRIPVYATVDTYVGIVMSQFGPALGKVANAVLRNADRARDDFYDYAGYVAGSSSEEQATAMWYSVPEWLVRLWQKSYGHEVTKQYLEASARPAPHSLRFNLQAQGAQEAFAHLYPYTIASLTHEGGEFDTDVAHLQGTESPNSGGRGDKQEGGQLSLQSVSEEEIQAQWAQMAHNPLVTFSGSLPLVAQKFIREGIVSQQSGAAQEVLAAMQPSLWKGPVWDCCCGRGGKTLALLEQGIDVVLASDVSSARLRGLESELKRLKLDTACHIEKISATKGLTETEFYKTYGKQTFGTILIDAPCSGFGTLARHPEIRFRRNLDDIATLVRLQREMLENAHAHVEEGGSIVYITCTVIPEENEEQIAQFIADYPNMQKAEVFATPSDSLYGEFFYGVRLIKG